MPSRAERHSKQDRADQDDQDEPGDEYLDWRGGLQDSGRCLGFLVLETGKQANNAAASG
jgi:hypothetical protein